MTSWGSVYPATARFSVCAMQMLDWLWQTVFGGKTMERGMLLLIGLWVCTACAEEPGSIQPTAERSQDRAHPAWQSLFNGKNLAGWKVSLFGGDGEIRATQGQLEIGFGVPMSGLRYLGKVPTLDYEIRLEAKRTSGTDFFCGLTFPVRQSHCSLIVGGWGGGVVGLSSIDGMDASENETTRYLSLEDNHWYRIRVRVTTTRIEAWLDDKQVINQELGRHQISLRSEMLPTRPLGLATWQTAATVKNFQIRTLK